LQSKIGHKTMVQKAIEYSPNNNRIIDPETYTSILKDEDINKLIMQKCTILERQALGVTVYDGVVRHS
jgi:hypothetical protein